MTWRSWFASSAFVELTGSALMLAVFCIAVWLDRYFGTRIVQRWPWTLLVLIIVILLIIIAGVLVYRGGI